MRATGGRVAYAVKAGIGDLGRAGYRFQAHKTMYGGRWIAAGDLAFLFASEREGGRGLFARGVVSWAAPVAREAGVARQTPRVDLAVEVSGRACRALGRAELRAFSAWGDGRAETEINFKLFRQATDKVVGLTAGAEAFLDGFF